MNPKLWPRFIGPGLALHAGSLTAEEYADLAVRLCARAPREETLIRAAVRRSGILRRHSVLATRAGDMPFYTEDRVPGGPGTQARMLAYEREAPGLALAAARDALVRGEVPATSITHLVTVSCTGFMSPGIDHHLIGALCLPAATRRTHIGFMGCHGAMNALGVARALCLADPRAVVLCVMVELCTLHYQYGTDRDDVLPNALFSDGAGACIVAGADSEAAHTGRFSLGEVHSHIVPGTSELMTWRAGDHGFRMTLDAAVPDAVGRTISRLVADWGWSTGDAGASWAIHPGGPRILDSAARSLGLPKGATAASKDILHRCGNMSSATMMFILGEVLPPARGPIRMLAFGPGLNIEGASLHPVTE